MDIEKGMKNCVKARNAHGEMLAPCYRGNFMEKVGMKAKWVFRGLPTWMRKLLTLCHIPGMDETNYLSQYGDSIALQSHFLA